MKMNSVFNFSLTFLEERIFGDFDVNVKSTKSGSSETRLLKRDIFWNGLLKFLVFLSLGRKKKKGSLTAEELDKHPQRRQRREGVRVRSGERRGRRKEARDEDK